MDDHERERYLAVYLNDHLAGATAGCTRFTRSARAHAGSATGSELSRLAAECEEDRRALRHWMGVLGVPVKAPLPLAGRVAEAVGALKPNGRLVRRSPLRTVVELEGLLLGVQGKGAGWRSLRELARTDARLDAGALEELVRRADRQATELERLRRTAVLAVLGA
ncbi:hypothetical protein [Kineococcus rhizosphaerae]|uniref:Uncharacterized protein n=1 Tax=Kineococcus rhizosphaerae TaxID=559628 RepID=A0A2T0R9J7_9ACTN|nr:hypothetical protein [Kineococcus rhizosphaerae]PRY17838.1 hypothetical protein CLV37_10175 [Kineococcus rhizosphaerae]